MTDPQITAKIQVLYGRLERFHWSAEHPTSYVVSHPQSGAKVGIGLIAMRCPGAFNLTYAQVQGRLTTLEDHQTAIRLLVNNDRITQFVIKTQQMSAWLTLLNEAEFRLWMKDAKPDTVGSGNYFTSIKEAINVPEVRRL